MVLVGEEICDSWRGENMNREGKSRRHLRDNDGCVVKIRQISGPSAVCSLQKIASD
jgi:hypothetical protein